MHQVLPLVVATLFSSVAAADQFSLRNVYSGFAGQPLNIAAADLNDDGVQDIVAADYAYDTLDVFLGNGDCTFTPAGRFDAGPVVFFVATGDFNGDGIPDAVTANYEDSNFRYTVAVVLGQGDGTFGPPAEFQAGNTPLAIAVADLDGDRHNDLVVSNGNDSRESVLLGNGDGTFQEAVNYDVGESPSGAAIGDFNEDGALDIAVASYNDNNVTVLLGVGDGSFTEGAQISIGQAPQDIAVADWSGDGHLDLGIAVEWSNSVATLRGNGHGNFSGGSFAVGQNPEGLVFVDLDGDGRLDLAATNAYYFDSSLSVLLNVGSSGFAHYATIPAGTRPWKIVALDCNSDGREDLAIGQNSADFLVFENFPDGIFADGFDE
jgi:hypothetical protein